MDYQPPYVAKIHNKMGGGGVYLQEYKEINILWNSCAL